MKLKTKDLKNAIKYSDKISFGIDYLRIKIDDVKSKSIYTFRDIFKKLDYDNSNYLHFTIDEYDLELTAQKIKLSNGEGIIVSYSYYGLAIPILVYIEYYGAYRELFNAIGKIDFYGSFFRLKELGYLDLGLFDELENFEITRIDYRIDFFNYKGIRIGPEIVKARKNSRLQSYKTNGYINSWRYGNKDNKTLLLRGYDKKLDIDKKGKFRLYGDYQNYDNIWRIEYEFLNKFCKGFTIKNIHGLVNKAKSYIGIDNIDFKGKYLYTYEKLDLSNEFAKTRYCKVMSSYIKQALINNINVYDYVDIELEKMGLSKKDIELIRNKSINLNDFNLLNKNLGQ